MTRVLEDDQIVLILTSQDSNINLSRRLGVSQQAISNVRLGVSYPSVRPDLPRTRRPRRARFTPSEIATIRASLDSNGKLATHYGVSRTTIADIRLGRTYRQSIYEAADADLQHCHKCNQWLNGCRLGFPEAETDPAFAAECHLYAT